MVARSRLMTSSFFTTLLYIAFRKHLTVPNFLPRQIPRMSLLTLFEIILFPIPCLLIVENPKHNSYHHRRSVILLQNNLHQTSPSVLIFLLISHLRNKRRRINLLLSHILVSNLCCLQLMQSILCETVRLRHMFCYLTL